MLARSIAVLLLAVLIVTLGACATTGGGGGVDNPTPTTSGEDPEEFARKKIGDVRVFYYVKPGTVGGGSGHAGVPTSTQKEIRTTLISNKHSLYAGMPDNQLKDDEYYIWNVDMHDLLVVLRDQVRFFEAPGAINIGDEDPINRAKNDPTVDRMISVEVLRDGKVACSYLARNWVEGGRQLDADQKVRYGKYNQAQELVLRCIRNALPRGTANRGEGGNLFPNRR